MDVKRKVTALIGEMDSRELAIRIIEQMIGIPRPTNRSVQQIIAATDRDTWECGLLAAEAALAYVAECMNAGRQPS